MRSVLLVCSGTAADLAALRQLLVGHARLCGVVQLSDPAAEAGFPQACERLADGKFPYLRVSLPPLSPLFGPGGGPPPDAGAAPQLQAALALLHEAAEAGAALLTTTRLTLPALYLLARPGAPFACWVHAGGAVFAGDCTPAAERTIRDDPAAAAIAVARAGALTFVPLEAAKTPAAGAVQVLLDPASAQVERYSVQVETESAASYGCLVCDVLCRDKTLPLCGFVTKLFDSGKEAAHRADA